ncbi:uncharacterized protein LOC128952779 [Oppia nitens]|uniref:uncharacterized protein LOC128952779 n=1 Tax=Oppia nitens TaxID=1686743 RepID=UPI0023DAEB97|nr:uncharacterized protein LOC128952779 [Oppia nitens]
MQLNNLQQFVATVLLITSITILARISCDDTSGGDQQKQSVQQMMSLFGEYSQKLSHAIQLIKENKISESGAELASVKDTFGKLNGLVKSNKELAKLPIASQLTELSSITQTLGGLGVGGDSNQALDGMVDKLHSVFGILGQVKDKVGGGVTGGGDGLGKKLPL